MIQKEPMLPEEQIYKQLITELCQKDKDKYSENLNKLLEMKLYDFNLNFQTLQECGNNLEQTVNELLSKDIITPACGDKAIKIEENFMDDLFEHLHKSQTLQPKAQPILTDFDEHVFKHYGFNSDLQAKFYQLLRVDHFKLVKRFSLQEAKDLVSNPKCKDSIPNELARHLTGFHVLLLVNLELLDTTFAIYFARDFFMKIDDIQICGESKDTRVFKIEGQKNLLSEIGCNTGFEIKMAKPLIQLQSRQPLFTATCKDIYTVEISLENQCDIYILQ